MISRVADHGLWLGRYLDRVESSARLLSATHAFAFDSDLTPLQCWRPVLVVAGEAPAFDARYGAARANDGELVQRHLALDEENLASIRNSLRAARENARAIREVVSLEVWETINGLWLWASSEEGRNAFDDLRGDYYTQLRDRTQLALGLMRGTMLHDEALDFIWLGVMLERMGWTARILDVHHHALPSEAVGPAAVYDATATALWLQLLHTLSGFEPYMKRHRGRVRPESVAEFLLLESSFPRSVRYCAREAHAKLMRIRPSTWKHLPGQATVARMNQVRAELDSMASVTLTGESLHHILTRVIDEGAAVSEGITREILGLGS